MARLALRRVCAWGSTVGSVVRIGCRWLLPVPPLLSVFVGSEWVGSAKCRQEERRNLKALRLPAHSPDGVLLFVRAREQRPSSLFVAGFLLRLPSLQSLAHPPSSPTVNASRLCPPSSPPLPLPPPNLLSLLRGPSARVAHIQATAVPGEAPKIILDLSVPFRALSARAHGVL